MSEMGYQITAARFIIRVGIWSHWVTRLKHQLGLGSTTCFRGVHFPMFASNINTQDQVLLHECTLR